MGIKSILAKPAAGFISSSVEKWKKRAVQDQLKWMNKLIQGASNTAFGRDHNFDKIQTYQDFKKNIPIKDYEGIKPYVERIKNGESDVLWKGLPIYFAKTSGTTSGVKYIPITKESVGNHVGTASKAFLRYIKHSGNSSMMDGKLIFLSGSPTLDKVGGIHTGRLSGIVNHHVPSWVRSNQMPSFETNCIEDWEEKLVKVVEETLVQDMRLIGGIPPWVQMYYERLLEVTGKKTVKEVFPNLSVFVYGGVDYEPYRAKLEELVGAKIDSIETYPASEGFIAFQDDYTDKGLLLNTDSGLFFEFIPVSEFFDENPTRVYLADVKLDVNYAIIINSNAGLWGYNIGDTVKFVSLDPYKLIVTGRIKHFISAFGEHVIGKEVENSLLQVASHEGLKIVEFTVAPQVNPPDGSLPYHEWFIEFDELPKDLTAFAKSVDKEMEKQNIYYEDLISGNILQPLKITPLEKDAFRKYMKSVDKLGGQNKVPRLSNDRKIADQLQSFALDK